MHAVTHGHQPRADYLVVSAPGQHPFDRADMRELASIDEDFAIPRPNISRNPSYLPLCPPTRSIFPCLPSKRQIAELSSIHSMISILST